MIPQYLGCVRRRHVVRWCVKECHERVLLACVMIPQYLGCVRRGRVVGVCWKRTCRWSVCAIRVCC